MNNLIRIGIVDSGVNVDHPHVGGIAGGITVEAEHYLPDYTDHLGHGTAVAALIHSLVPFVPLFAVRVFDQRLSTNIHRVIRAIDWCLDNGIQIINLSLGTVNQDYLPAFATAAQRVRSSGAVLISAHELNGQRMLPGCIPGVIGVTADPSCSRDEYSSTDREGKVIFGACPYPLEIPGVPREHNLKGVSFAVAHMTAHLAGSWGMYGPQGNWEEHLVSTQIREPSAKPLTQMFPERRPAPDHIP